MEFTEFFKELITLANLPVTIMMGMVVLYWLMVILGVLGMDAIDLDLGMDADLDFDPGLDASPDGMFSEALTFMHMGEVPAMIVGSIVVFFMWILTVLSNHYINSEQNLLFAFLFIVPNLLISLIATKALIWPFVNIFKSDQTMVETRENMIGLTGAVMTSVVNDKFGQIEIQIDGPPVVINARTQTGEELAKGDNAKIDAYNPVNDTFTVSLAKWENK